MNTSSKDNHKSKSLSEEVASLVLTLNRIDERLKKRVSFRQNFLLSLVNGAGYALGATIVAGLVIALLAQTVRTINDVQILNRVIQTEQVGEKLEEYSRSY